jgi:hypothetical protein
LQPLKAEARVLQPPTIVYKNGNSAVDADTGKWVLRDSFLVPVEISKWAIYMIPGSKNEMDRRGQFTFENLR